LELTDLVVRQQDPFNAETPLGPQIEPLTRTEHFYVRSHFAIPDSWRGLAVDGLVSRPLQLDLDEVKRLPRASVTTTMECAGNGRIFLDPPVGGVQWQLGAVGTAEWSGTGLESILALAGVKPGAVEMVFQGSDRGAVAEKGQVAFARSLPVHDAGINSVLVAYEMNGEPLTPAHGAPLRLVVPGWYGMASVKWLERITAAGEPFRGYFQVDDYVVIDDAGVRPCREMEIRSIIVNPTPNSAVPVGQPILVRGFAWSGRGALTRVELSADGGITWTQAGLAAPVGTHVWQSWQLDWTPAAAGAHCLLVRAHDSAGNTQALEQVWNVKGYANNAVTRHEVIVTGI